MMIQRIKDSKLWLMLLVSLLFAWGAHASEVNDLTPVPVEDRLQVLTTYYGENVDNPDPSVLNHYQKWHDQDVQVIASRLKNLQLEGRLKEYSNVMSKSFDMTDPNMTFAKLGTAYYLYSRLISNANNSTQEEDQEITAEAVKFLTTSQQTPKEYWKNGVLRFKYYTRELDLINFCKRGFRILPFVSENGFASFRDLNHSFGLRTPVFGLPLKSNGYDGNAPGDVDEERFYCHDTQHARMYDQSTWWFDQEMHNNNLPEYYEVYRKFDRLVQSIIDPREKILCDWFLFELGHEGTFGYNDYSREFNQHYQTNIPPEFRTPVLEPSVFPPKFITSSSFDAMCDGILQGEIANLRSLQSLETAILKMDLPKNRLLLGEEVNDDIPFTYNSLFNLKDSLQESLKINYEVWIDDHINIEGAIDFYRLMTDTFKRVIGPKFTAQKAQVKQPANPRPLSPIPTAK
jgi:hypothetical protein